MKPYRIIHLPGMMDSAYITRVLAPDAGYSRLGDLVKQHINGGGKVFILTDETVNQHCMPRLLQYIPELEQAHVLEVEPGESTKDLQIVKQLWEALSESCASRKDLFICLGGGMICDLGGFTAGTYKRGLPVYYIPTTLMAQVDAAIGGKNAINFNHVKNLVGMFRLPELVIIDPGYLETLPQRQLISGMAEIIKAGLALEKELWTAVTRGDGEDPESFRKIVERSATVKASICEADFHDQSERQKLNFGHTIGHVLESLSIGSAHEAEHGEAVAAGMLCESWISFRKGLLKESTLKEITDFISNRFPEVFADYSSEDFMRVLRQDKKANSHETSFVLLNDIGSSLTGVPVELAMIMASLEFYKGIYAAV